MLKIIPNQQHRIVPGRSIMTNLPDCTYKLLYYLGFAKTFDWLSHKKLPHKLNYVDIRGHFLKWIQVFFTNKNDTVCVGNVYLSKMSVLNGVPQESILRSAFFNVYVWNFLGLINSDCNSYADDLKLFCKSLTLYDQL